MICISVPGEREKEERWDQVRCSNGKMEVQKEVKSLKTTREVCWGKWGFITEKQRGSTSEADVSPLAPPNPHSSQELLPEFVRLNTLLSLQVRRLSFRDISDWLKVPHFIIAKQASSLNLPPSSCFHQ